MAINFSYANDRNYSITATIIVSRRFVSMGRKSCLFVCYGKTYFHQAMDGGGSYSIEWRFTS